MVKNLKKSMYIYVLCEYVNKYFIYKYEICIYIYMEVLVT